MPAVHGCTLSRSAFGSAFGMSLEQELPKTRLGDSDARLIDYFLLID